MAIQMGNTYADPRVVLRKLLHEACDIPISVFPRIDLMEDKSEEYMAERITEWLDVVHHAAKWLVMESRTYNAQPREVLIEYVKEIRIQIYNEYKIDLERVLKIQLLT